MNNIDLRNFVYSVFIRRNLTLTDSPVKFGQVFSGPQYRSSANNTMGFTIKVNAASVYLEELIEPEVSLIEIRDNKYLYVDKTERYFSVYDMTENVLRISEDSAQGRLHGVLAVFAAAIEHDFELGAIYRSCLQQYNEKKKINTADAVRFSDAFYYGFARKISSVNTEYLSREEVVALCRKPESGISDIPKLFKNPLTSKITRKTVVVKEEKADEDNTLKECMDGKHIIPYKWKEEQAEYIQPLDSLEDYIPNSTFRKLLNKVEFRLGKVLGRMGNSFEDTPQNRAQAIGKDYLNITLTGKPGTGKTRTAYALGAATGLPVYTVNLSQNTDEDEFGGMTKMIDGKPSAVPTDFIKAFSSGGIIVLEEVNLPQAAVIMGSLGQAVEFPFVLKEQGYKPIRRHPLCVIISTMNVGTAGSKAVSQPFANRFKQSYILDDPKKEEFVAILEKNTGAENKICSWVYDVYSRVTKCIESENMMADTDSLLMALSMRSCMGAIQNIEEGERPLEAVRDSIINKLAEQDLEVAKTCMTAIESMPNCPI